MARSVRLAPPGSESPAPFFPPSTATACIRITWIKCDSTRYRSGLLFLRLLEYFASSSICADRAQDDARRPQQFVLPKIGRHMNKAHAPAGRRYMKGAVKRGIADIV